MSTRVIEPYINERAIFTNLIFDIDYVIYLIFHDVGKTFGSILH